VRKFRQAARTNVASESATAQLKTRPNKLKTGPNPAENISKRPIESVQLVATVIQGSGGGDEIFSYVDKNIILRRREHRLGIT
jgi:hypothetical protein